MQAVFWIFLQCSYAPIRGHSRINHHWFVADHKNYHSWVQLHSIAQNKLCHGSVWYCTEFRAAHGHWKTQLVSLQRWQWHCSINIPWNPPHRDVMGGDPAQLRVLLPKYPEQRDLVTEKAQGGLSPHTNHGVWVGQSQGRWKSALPTPAMENLLKSSNTSWERLRWPRLRSKPELKCSDRVWTMETEDYQWPESFVQGARICLIPGVTQSSVTELCLRPDWSTKFGGGGAGKKSRKEPESLLLIPSENAASQPKANRRETNRVQ